MPVIRKEGKDTIIFVTKEDHAIPSQIVLPEPESRPGLFLPNGEINWNCPCLGGVATGPCGIEFREAFSCFQKFTNESKEDCYPPFKEMQKCMAQYPSLYNKEKELDLNDLDDNDAVNNDPDKKAIKHEKLEISNEKSENVISSKKEIELSQH
jgi:intermembrane space import and assembly protein 40